MAFEVFYHSLHMGIAPADPNGYHANRNKKHNYKTLYRFDLNGKFISEVKFNRKNAEELGISYSSVSVAMRPTWTEKRRTLSAMNSIWIIKEDFSEEELQRKVFEKSMDSNMNPKAHKSAKRIVQRDAFTKEVIWVWDSLNQAGKEEKTGYKLSSICRVLNGSRKTYAGYVWEYETKEKKES